MFDLARAGEAERLAAYVEAGVPVDLTDASGNTLLMLAAYHGHATTVGRWPAPAPTSTGSTTGARARSPGPCSRTSRTSYARCSTPGPTRDAGSPTARETAAMFGRPDLFG